MVVKLHEENSMIKGFITVICTSTWNLNAKRELQTSRQCLQSWRKCEWQVNLSIWFDVNVNIEAPIVCCLACSKILDCVLGLAAEAEANRVSNDTEQKEEDEDGDEHEPNNVGEEDEEVDEEMDENKVEEDEGKVEEVEEVKEPEEVKDEVIVDQNHPEVWNLIQLKLI